MTSSRPKMVFAARRHPDLAPEEFYAYWLDVHAQLARRIPGVVRYVVNLPAGERDAATRAYDGVAEISYASREALRAAVGTPEVEATMADEANLFDPASVVRLWVEEHVIVS